MSPSKKWLYLVLCWFSFSCAQNSSVKVADSKHNKVDVNQSSTPGNSEINLNRSDSNDIKVQQTDSTTAKLEKNGSPLVRFLEGPHLIIDIIVGLGTIIVFVAGYRIVKRRRSKK
jgi:hypothetical protein